MAKYHRLKFLYLEIPIFVIFTISLQEEVVFWRIGCVGGGVETSDSWKSWGNEGRGFYYVGISALKILDVFYWNVRTGVSFFSSLSSLCTKKQRITERSSVLS